YQESASTGSATTPSPPASRSWPSANCARASPRLATVIHSSTAVIASFRLSAACPASKLATAGETLTTASPMARVISVNFMSAYGSDYFAVQPIRQIRNILNDIAQKSKCPSQYG